MRINLKKLYIKKFCEISKFSVWIVDGNFIRNNLDEEFTNFGQHYKFKFIPKHEFWIDKEYETGEEIFYLDHMLIENRLMSKGKSYSFALRYADIAEKRERLKSYLSKNSHNKQLNKKNISGIYKKIIKKTNKISFWLVNGELVRDLFDLDFTEGGHDKVYPYIPAGEIWIDDDLFPKERKLILLHESYERNLMCKGMKYNNAHRKSSAIEYYCRHNPSFLREFLKKELDKFN